MPPEQTSAPPERKPTIYVLVGLDQEGAFPVENKILSENPNCKLISYKDYPNIEDAVKQIKSPAKVILDCHGFYSGEFTWNDDGRNIHYDRLFTLLKALQDGGKGIESVTMCSCYGGSTARKDIVEAAPPGTIVQSLVGPFSVGSSFQGERFAMKAGKGGSSTDLLLEALASFNSNEHFYDIDNFRSKHPAVSDYYPDLKQEDALPHILGIGGKPPVLIDLDKELPKLVKKHPAPNDPIWKKAVDKVHEKFGVSELSAKDVKAVEEKIWENSLHESNIESDFKDYYIQMIAEGMQQGIMPEGIRQKRVAYALTAAYLDKSGELATLVEAEKNKSPKSLISPATQPSVGRATIPNLNCEVLAAVQQHSEALSSHILRVIDVSATTPSLGAPRPVRGCNKLV